LVRRLQDHGFLVTVVPTPASLNFVGKATWEALSGRPVHTEVWENIPDVPHIALGERADLVVIAPATADLLARVASGRADDLLTNCILATHAPILFVPAMHPQMWSNPATVANVETLRERGYVVMDPDTGRLTGRDSGQGRFPETSRIISAIEELSLHRADLIGKKVLVTAGGTREAIDPIRFIGNLSSGKQGYALAWAAAARGAEVTLISANSQLPDIEGISTIHVVSAAEMEAEVKTQFPKHDVLIMSAAVADARPENVIDEKIKKEQLQNISLIKNVDILAAMGKVKRSDQVLVGFAAETALNSVELGRAKRIAKGADLLYVNNVKSNEIFGSDTTAGTIISGRGEELITGCSKDTLANILLDKVVDELGYANV
jgi:phosphopantothenoylcysteine decarboxylase/phosphopantothenate--cysteine ligase